MGEAGHRSEEVVALEAEHRDYLVGHSGTRVGSPSEAAVAAAVAVAAEALWEDSELGTLEPGCSKEEGRGCSCRSIDLEDPLV